MPRHGQPPVTRRTILHSIVNNYSDASLDQVQAYRIVARIAGSPLPPACFFVSAIRALRADASERVLILAGNGSQHIVDDVVTALGTSPFPEYSVLHGGAEVREDGNQPFHLTPSLLSATRVVWGDASASLPILPHRLIPRGDYKHEPPRWRQPYEVVWTWCNTNAANGACTWLPHQSTDFEVQVRAHGAEYRDTSPRQAASINADVVHRSHRRCLASDRLEVRSTWSKVHWYSMSRLTSVLADRKRVQLTRGEWMLEDVCLGYGYTKSDDRNARERFNILAQADGRSRQLLWPIPWPDVYAEYDPGFIRLDSQTAGHYISALVNITSPNSPLSRCTWHEATSAFVGEMTMDNLYHALIHAVPTRELYARLTPLLQTGTLHLLPHYTQYWPAAFNVSVGWQILVRSLGTNHKDWDSVAALAQRLTAPGGCNCYRRMYGGHSAFMPPPYMNGAALLSRVAAFTRALAKSAGVEAVKRRVLFQLRRNGIRQIVNEDEVRAAVAGDSTLAATVYFAVMEHLPVMEQHALVSSSTALAGMHGMGLAWTMLLSSSAIGRSSCLEITGEWAKFNRADYVSLSLANNVHYVRVIQKNWPGCFACKRCNYRNCGNVTANATQLVEALHYMVRRFDHPGEGGGCARHPSSYPLQRFGLIQRLRIKCPTIEALVEEDRERRSF